MEDNQVSYAIVGCGINVSQQRFPEEIKDIATSILLEGSVVTKAALLASILEEVAARYPDFVNDPSAFLPEYRANCATLGHHVRIESALPEEGTAFDISGQGDLLVRRTDGTLLTCMSGEVSVRGMLGYM